MRYYSTKSKNSFHSLREAVLKSLPDDNGLFMPELIPVLPASFFEQISNYSFQDIATTVARAFLKGELPDAEIERIARESVNFPVPLKTLDATTSVLELFHGPTLAFKDVGARFMARVMAWLNKDEDRKLTILVATSGDTGSAVANGFFKVPGIEVIILYPSGKVSHLQEKQLTTLGHNITAIEVKGSFDDCQALVKQAFLDSDLREKYRLSSANSINIARLIPQSFYYIDAWKQVENRKIPVVCSVPSGNFGNLTAGLLAQRMGLPIHHFIAANNSNRSVVDYLEGAEYSTRATIPTISNAMDVGHPSNFVRMLDLFGGSRSAMQKAITACSFSDQATREVMQKVYRDTGYILDPHGAVAYLGWKSFEKHQNSEVQGVFLETAHPAKFQDVVEETLSLQLEIPDALENLKDKVKTSILLNADYSVFFRLLIERI